MTGHEQAATDSPSPPSPQHREMPARRPSSTPRPFWKAPRAVGLWGVCCRFSVRRSSPRSPTWIPATSPPTSRAARNIGYLLIWVVVASNLMAMLVQSLSAKLGIATGLNLPEMIRQEFPRPSSGRSGGWPKWSRWPPTSPSSWARRSASICCSGSRSCRPAILTGGRHLR